MKLEPVKKAARYIISSAGIIIGIAVAVVILGMADGGKSVLKHYFWSNGVKVYDIELKGEAVGSDEYLQWKDARLIIDKMPEARGSIPVLRLEARLKSYKASFTAQTLAVNEKYQQYANLELLAGNFINEQDVRHANKVTIIDDLTALELFGTTDILGQKLDLTVAGKTVEFTVSGVFRSFNRNIETLFEKEIPGMCFIPDSVPEDVSWAFRVEKLIALISDSLHKEEAAVRLGHLLEKEHGVTGVYNIEEYEQLSEVGAFTDKYIAFAVIISIVALISGGVGVMNAMLLTVQERKKEIGLYKFYGAGIKELQLDLLFKTLIVCLGSGVTGALLGLAAAAFIGSYVNVSPGVTFMSVFIITAASAVTAIAGSVYPAVRIGRVKASEAIWGE